MLEKFLAPGGLIKKDAFTQTLTGAANDYSGTTSIEAGVLQAGAANAFSSASEVSLANVASAILNLDSNNNSIVSLSGGGSTGGNVSLGSGTLTIIPTANKTYAGNISGIGGGLTLAGMADFILSGNNTYSGTTTINANKLIADSATAFSPSSAVVLANTSGVTLDLNNKSNSIASLSGGGSTGGNVTLGTGDLTIGTSTGTTTFSGVISETGGLTKTGASTQVLNGTNTYTGPTAINAGVLSITSPGSITSNVTVGNGGTLKGTGTIAGDVLVNNGGTISPGNSVGTMPIDGKLELSGTSNTDIDICPTITDKIIITGTPGTALLDGNLNLITLPALYPPDMTYTILTATGGLTLDGSTSSGFSEFASIDVGSLFNVVPNYLSNSVILNIHFTNPLIPTENLSGNQLILANYFNAESSFFFEAIFRLFKLPTKEIKFFLDSISPARLAASTSVVANVGFESIQIIVDREQQSRFLHFRRSKSFDSVVALRDETLFSLNEKPAPLENIAKQALELDETFPAGSTRAAGSDDHSAAGYGNWTGQWIHEKRQKQNPAFNTFATQGNIGVEKFFANGFFGAQGKYAHTTISQDAVSEVNLYGSSLYGTAYVQDAFFDICFSVFGTSYKNKRRLVYPNMNAIASSHHKGYSLIPHLGAGYDFGFRWGALEPYASVDWAYIHENSFTEKGPFSIEEVGEFPPIQLEAESLNMHIYKRHSSVLRNQIGLNAYQAFDGDWGTLFLKEELFYVYLIPFHLGHVKAIVPGAQNNFTVFALTQNQSRARASFELFFRAKKGVFLSTRYSTEVGSRAFSQSISGTLGRYF